VAYVKQLLMFVRVYELGSMSAAARDQRVSPAVASSRISDLESHLGIRLFNRTTRSLQATEQGKIFYDGAKHVLQAIQDAEAAVTDVSRNPRGTIFAAVPLGIGRRFIAPHVPEFKDIYPQIDLRLRLSDRTIDVTGEGLDVAFVLGQLKDSNLRVRVIEECPRVLCAAPSYIERRGLPMSGSDLVDGAHDCLLLRFPGASEFRWTLSTAKGPERFQVSGPFESDDGEVLTNWALDGRGIVNKPIFEVVEHLKSGALVAVAEETPPVPITLACLYPHKRFQDPKVRLFIDFMVARCREELGKRSFADRAPPSGRTAR
jgi:DNA-binding transcriptional LysR family regulator